MGTLTLIVAIAALAVAIVALVIALRRQNVIEVETVKETVKVEHAPVEHPFTYDEGKKAYTLTGNLEVTGAVSCLKEKEG